MMKEPELCNTHRRLTCASSLVFNECCVELSLEPGGFSNNVADSILSLIEQAGYVSKSEHDARVAGLEGRIAGYVGYLRRKKLI